MGVWRHPASRAGFSRADLPPGGSLCCDTPGIVRAVERIATVAIAAEAVADRDAEAIDTGSRRLILCPCLRVFLPGKFSRQLAPHPGSLLAHAWRCQPEWEFKPSRGYCWKLAAEGLGQEQAVVVEAVLPARKVHDSPRVEA